MKELPEDDEAVAQWCRDVFVVKDALLDEHNSEDTFSDKEIQNIKRPLKSLLVVISWACLVLFGIMKYLQWSSLLSLWKGVAVLVSSLGVVTLLMNILIRFSQSERSTPAQVAPARRRTSAEASEARAYKRE